MTRITPKHKSAHVSAYTCDSLHRMYNNACIIPVVVQLYRLPLAFVVDGVEAHDGLEEGMQSEVCVWVD